MEAMSHSVTVLGEPTQYLPMSSYMPQVENAFGEDAIIVGSWTILVAKGTPVEGQSYLLYRLGEFLKSQGFGDVGKIELSFSSLNLKDGAPRDGNPSFQVKKTVRGFEISFLLIDSSGKAASGRVTFATGSPANSTEGVKPNWPVRVIFRKGPITVEVPGKALAYALPGENAKVLISESKKTFIGKVIDGEAVSVDLQ
jgi:hypothetical protein